MDDLSFSPFQQEPWSSSGWARMSRFVSDVNQQYLGNGAGHQHSESLCVFAVSCIWGRICLRRATLFLRDVIIRAWKFGYLSLLHLYATCCLSALVKMSHFSSCHVFSPTQPFYASQLLQTPRRDFILSVRNSNRKGGRKMTFTNRRCSFPSMSHATWLSCESRELLKLGLSVLHHLKKKKKARETFSYICSIHEAQYFLQEFDRHRKVIPCCWAPQNKIQEIRVVFLAVPVHGIITSNRPSFSSGLSFLICRKRLWLPFWAGINFTVLAPGEQNVTIFSYSLKKFY